MKNFTYAIRRLPVFLWKALLAGVPLVGSLVGFVVFLVLGLSGVALAGLALRTDPLLILAVIGLTLLLAFFLGAFRIWDEADTREAAEVVRAGSAEVPPELELRDLAKEGRQILEALTAPSFDITDKFTAQGVSPWSARVRKCLLNMDADYVKRFQDADNGTPPWSPLVTPGKYTGPMKKRLSVVDEILDERDAA